MIQKIDVKKIITETGIIPLLTTSDINFVISLVDIICGSGCRLIEYGLRSTNSLDNYLILKEYIESNYKNVYLGAGSVTEKIIAKKIIDIGTDFIIGPGFSEEIFKECKKADILYIPGCATATEIIKAKEIGISIFKIFPAKYLGGYQYLKSLKSALPWLRALPAGGIKSDPEIIKEWFNAGAEAVTIGSDLFGKYENNDNLEILRNEFKSLLDEVKKFKS